ncbi:MAG: NAD(P)-dependent oxidoreductase [Solirubrobacterales bacterium]
MPPETSGPEAPAAAPPVAPSTSGRRRVAVTAEAVDRFHELAPRTIEISALTKGLDLETVDFLVPTHLERWIVEPLPSLRRVAVVQLLSAGSDWIDGRLPPQATLCNARGARDGPVAEWVVSALLGASSRTLEGARRRAWADRGLADLASWTVLVVGMGSIGRRVRWLLEPFGTRVVGIASTAREGLYGVDELASLLPDADAVVILAPLSDDTRGLIGTPELAAMRDGTLLVNAARGAIVDTDALLAEVIPGRLRAVLDVTDPEPLPRDHALSNAPGVLSITPHIAGDSPLGNRRAIDLAARQLARWMAGEELDNVVRGGVPEAPVGSR